LLLRFTCFINFNNLKEDNRMVIKLFKKDNPEKLNEIGISLAEEGKY